VTHLARPVKHNQEVIVHTGAAETGARLLLLDADALAPGESCWAQLRLSRAVPIAERDGFIIRDPGGTIGGGHVADTNANRHRRFHAPTIGWLREMLEGTPETRILGTLARMELMTAEALGAAGEADANAVVASLIEDGRIICLGDPSSPKSFLLSEPGLESLLARALRTLADFHRRFPLREGMPREELRKRLDLPSAAFDGLVARITADGTVKAGEVISLGNFQPQLSRAQQREADAFLKALRSRPYSPPTDSVPEVEVIDLLVRDFRIVDVGAGVYFDAASWSRMVAGVTAHIRARGSITLAQVRDMFGTTRKYAQPLLEHMDQQRITRRAGDARVLGPRSDPAGD
jgi:selenocysteine-specific elongation factor